MTKRFKINPDYTCPELAGYKLPEVEWRMEDDVEGMAKEEFNNIDKPIRSGVDYHSYKVGFADGYHKAREKFIFPMETIDKIREVLCNGIATNMSMASAIVEFDKIVYNQLAPRHPIAIDVEMVDMPKPQPEKYGYYNSESFDDMPSGWMLEGGEDAYHEALNKWEIGQPATNPDGTVKGRYIYE